MNKTKLMPFGNRKIDSQVKVVINNINADRTHENKFPSHPAAVCDEAGEQHDEEMPGCCGCPWFFHTQLSPMFA